MDKGIFVGLIVVDEAGRGEQFLFNMNPVKHTVGVLAICAALITFQQCSSAGLAAMAGANRDGQVTGFKAPKRGRKN